MGFIGKNIADVMKRIDEAYSVSAARGSRFPRLVAVSKEKPVEYVIEAYKCGQRHFGENLIISLMEKSKSPEVLEVCKDIRWHFIGRIQSNKIKQLCSVTNLYMVETVDTIDHAQSLDRHWKAVSDHPLNIMLQVNTSNEAQKGGTKLSDLVDLYRGVQATCPNLKFTGLMCIGRFGFDNSKASNPDFLELLQCRDKLIEECNLPADSVELSMGMSGDFEHAIHLGSTNVRVGTTIFGSRSH